MLSKRSFMPPRRSPWGLIALGGCVSWLLLQNSLLLVWLSRQHLEPFFTVARDLLRVALHVASDLWMLPVAVFLGVALALSSGEDGRRRNPDREVSRV